MELFSTCKLGVSRLNQKLGVAAADELKPVSVISASESKTVTENSTKIAMLVQLAPLTDCLSESATATEQQDRCVVYNEWRFRGQEASNAVCDDT
ncbi:unnamed protein product [Phytophthora lilii]|uniref:Unnamed protein product n=1 Tax=Phytophthora lilii TaxID=2077276 RepID=A0A9W6WEG7_9STRA|nr:unnamed protein product [Phytophthora lilii]